MKNCLRLYHLFLFCGAVPSGLAQFGPGGSGLMGGAPQGAWFQDAMIGLFGEHKAFTANVDFVLQDGNQAGVTMPGTFAFLDGRSRVELDFTRMKGAQMPAETAAQVRAMGMGEMLVISRPDQRLVYLIYPGLQSYVEQKQAGTSNGDAQAAGQLKLATTELGRETVAGRPCVKNKVVITDRKGTKHAATVWNASDLRKFPVKIAYSEDGSSATVSFRDVQLVKPDLKLFEPPSGFTRYDDMQSLIQNAIIQRLGGGGSPPRKP